MSYKLTFHPFVQQDISEAYNWYEDKLQGLGERFMTELDTCYDKLEKHPEYFGKVIKDYRRILTLHFPYAIVYEIVETNVFVYAVFHSSRNPKEILKRSQSK